MNGKEVIRTGKPGSGVVKERRDGTKGSSATAATCTPLLGPSVAQCSKNTTPFKGSRRNKLSPGQNLERSYL